MKTKVTEICRKGDYSLLVKLEDKDAWFNSPQPFIVALAFDPNTRSWASGDYFEDLQIAVAHLYSKADVKMY